MSPAGGAAAALAGGGDAIQAAHGAQLGAREFAAIAAILQSEARIALSEAKTTLVQSRLARRLRAHGLASYADYVALVERDPEERGRMVVALTTNHTHFFREPHHFDHLRNVVMPELQQRARQRPIRIWSAGCSSGEEVYTIAMCLLGHDRTSASWVRGADLRLLATDISPPMVAAVTRAWYPENAVAGIPEPYRSQWLVPEQDGFAIASMARDLVTANVLNLFEPWPLKAQYDAIFCRNVMIYFDDAAKAELEARLVDQLAPGGHLYIGHSERLIGAAAARMKSCGHTIYRKEDGR